MIASVATDSHHRLGVAANLLDGDFVAAAPNQKWAGDITNVWTSEGWLYLAVILDLHGRRVVGSRATRMLEGFKMLPNLVPPAGSVTFL